MRIFKKYLALLMAATILLTTMAAASASEITGAYVETQIEFDQSGKLVGLAQGANVVVAALQNGETGEVFFYQIGDAAATGLNCTFNAGTEDQLKGIDVDSTGNITVLTETSSDSDVTASIYRQNGDTFEKLFDYDSFANTFAALDSGEYILDGKNGLSIFDASGKETGNLDLEAQGFAADRDMLFAAALTDQGTNVLRYNWRENRSLDDVVLDGISYLDYSAISGDGNGGFYCVYDKYIMHVGAGSTKFEILIEDASKAYAYPGNQVRGVGADADGSIYVWVSNFENGMECLYQYAWSDTEPVREKLEFTVASITDDYQIKRAIADFMRLNPEVNITYRAYLPYSYAETLGFHSTEEMEENRTRYDDAIRNINTEILSGNAPDILLLDGMNVANLVEKGLLDDMSAWAQKYLDDGTLLSGPVEGFRREDGMLPCIPLSFNVPVIWADRQLIGSLNNFDDLARAAISPVNDHLFDLTYDRKLLLSVYPIFEASWTGEDGKVSFTKEQLSDFLAQLKTIQDTLPEAEVSEGNNVDMENMLSGKTDAMIENLGEAQLQSYRYTLLKSSGKDPALTWLPAVDGVHAYRPSTMVGISAASENKDIAYALLDMIIADANSEQSETEYENYSIVADRARRQLEKGTTVSDDDSPITTYNGKDIMLETVDGQTFADMYRVISEVNTPVFQDYTLMTMMLQTCEPYLAGEESLESVVEKFYGYIKAYLAE